MPKPTKDLELTICLGIGDNIIVRLWFDTIKHNYRSIKISHSRQILRFFRNDDQDYLNFATQLGKLLFSESPYQFVNDAPYPLIQTTNILSQFNTLPQKPNLDHLLCKGNPLDIKDYIVITTKVRCIDKTKFILMSKSLWQILHKLSERYPIVIMGERKTELSKENIFHRNTIFCIYDQIVANIPSNLIIDLTIPALGITTPDLEKIQQDCLIMKNAKAVITFGIGGNVWMSAAVANTIGYRDDNDAGTNLLATPSFKNLSLIKNWDQFINKISNL